MGRRPSSFRVERRVDKRVSANAFSGSGYDRGIWLPTPECDAVWAGGSVRTFVMSNVIAQRPWLNQCW